MDIPDDLFNAYTMSRESGVLADLSKERGVDVELRIRHDLLKNAGEQVFANPESYTNMSPIAWRSLVTLGKVIDEPRYVHDVVRRLKKFVDLQFFYDGSWYVGAPSYGAQTVSGLEQVLAELRGYSDPVGFTDPVDGKRLENLDLEKEFPTLRQARSALQKLKLPNGREVPINDTWAPASQRNSSRRRDLGASAIHSNSYLLPAMGHACMNFGNDQQATQFHLSWSGGYGHQHADGLNLILFAHEKEMLSDLGYTHTAYRPWATSTVAHNTVVIDGLSQAMGSRQSPSDGSLRFADFLDKRVKVVSADAKRVYPGTAMLHAIDRGEIVVRQVGLTLPVAGDVVRLETDDAWTYPFNVTYAERDGDAIRIRVAEGPGMEFQAENNRLRLTSFPQREHTGTVYIEWMTGNSR